MRRELIGVEIFVVLRQIYIVPDQILRAVEIAAFQIILGHIQRRNMIAVHHEDGRFLTLGERICQLLDKLIHLVNLIDIVFIFPLQILRRRRGDLNRRILNDLLDWILAVSLHRYRIDHIAPLCRIQRVSNAIRQHIVLRPVLRRLFDIFHVFHTREGVKAHVRKNAVAVVKDCPVIMNRVRGVAETVEVVGKAFSGFFF